MEPNFMLFENLLKFLIFKMPYRCICFTINAYTIADMKTFAYQSQTNLLGKGVAFMKH